MRKEGNFLSSQSLFVLKSRACLHFSDVFKRANYSSVPNRHDTYFFVKKNPFQLFQMNKNPTIMQARRNVFKITGNLLHTLKKHRDILCDLLNKFSKSTGTLSRCPCGSAGPVFLLYKYTYC